MTFTISHKLSLTSIPNLSAAVGDVAEEVAVVGVVVVVVSCFYQGNQALANT